MYKKTKEIISDKVKSEKPGGKKYFFQLFVSGNSLGSVRAVINSKAIFEKYLKDSYILDIIDIQQQPSLALKENIIALPVLIKKTPLPEIRMIGDLTDTKKVLSDLLLV